MPRMRFSPFGIRAAPCENLTPPPLRNTILYEPWRELLFGSSEARKPGSELRGPPGVGSEFRSLKPIDGRVAAQASSRATVREFLLLYKENECQKYNAEHRHYRREQQ
jgi:hypothetical protein